MGVNLTPKPDDAPPKQLRLDLDPATELSKRKEQDSLEVDDLYDSLEEETVVDSEVNFEVTPADRMAHEEILRSQIQSHERCIKVLKEQLESLSQERPPPRRVVRLINRFQLRQMSTGKFHEVEEIVKQPFWPNDMSMRWKFSNGQEVEVGAGDRMEVYRWLVADRGRFETVVKPREDREMVVDVPDLAKGWTAGIIK